MIAGLHLLPDAWSAARGARIWAPAVPAAAIASFALAGLAARGGCACGSERRHAGGAGAAAALAVHRFLEGSALALAASVIVAAALAVHALAEGLAVGALLGGQSRRRVAGWLAVMCLSPVAGAVTASALPMPAAVGPVLLAVAAGVLGHAARISLSAARHSCPRRQLTPRPAVAPEGCHHRALRQRTWRHAPQALRNRYRPPGKVIACGTTSGLPTSSWIWACAFSGMFRGLPTYRWPL